MKGNVVGCYLSFPIIQNILNKDKLREILKKMQNLRMRGLKTISYSRIHIISLFICRYKHYHEDSDLHTYH